MPFEVAALIGVAVAPLPESIPVALPLLVVATLARWVRGRSWAELVRPGGALIGATAGVVALLVAVTLGTPLVEHLTDQGVEWSRFPVVRGNVSQLIAVALVVGATTVAAELALRGWLVERVLELSRAPAILAVLVGAFAEALLTDGGLSARIGGACFGAALGWIYVASGRNLAASLCARLAFQLGALALEWLRMVG